MTGVGVACARVALVGNPSDGYGGRTLAIDVPALRARVTATPAATDDAPIDLLRATLARVERPHPARLAFTTDIPREVGLAGSSALVIAALRALTDLEPDALAELALSIERDDLGIAAGMQDRLVQARSGLLAMDFATGAHRALDARAAGPLVIAWRTDGGTPSGVFHGALRARYDAGDRTVHAAMRELAELTERAARDLDRELGPAMDRTFDIRAEIADLDPRDVALVHAARAHGAHANYAGSGGAIAALHADPDALAAALDRAGYGVLVRR